MVSVNKEHHQQMMTLAVIGGDQRQRLLVDQLRLKGYKVYTAAVDGFDDDYLVDSNMDFIILPSPGVDDQGNVKPNQSNRFFQITEQWVAGLPKHTTLCIGIIPDRLNKWCEQQGIRLISYVHDEPYQIANAIPTAEGAILLTLQQSSKTIYGSKSVICGFGKCGMALALRLQGLGSQVSVAVRKPRDIALGQSFGLKMIEYPILADALTEADFIYNTVPNLVLDGNRLQAVAANGLIIDLASAPGGCDFDACQQLGIQAILASNLPGKYFPQTAGQMLTEVIEAIIQRNNPTSAGLQNGGC